MILTLTNNAAFKVAIKTLASSHKKFNVLCVFLIIAKNL